jgi:hypothetical protein
MSGSDGQRTRCSNVRKIARRSCFAAARYGRCLTRCSNSKLAVGACGSPWRREYRWPRVLTKKRFRHLLPLRSSFSRSFGKASKKSPRRSIPRTRKGSLVGWSLSDVSAPPRRVRGLFGFRIHFRHLTAHCAGCWKLTLIAHGLRWPLRRTCFRSGRQGAFGSAHFRHLTANRTSRREFALISHCFWWTFR